MVAISKFNNRYRNLQNKLAILLIISCCLTSIAFLVNKIDRANKSDGNDLDDDDVLGEKDLFLVSSVLKNPSTQQDKDLLFLSFISKKNNLSAALKCVSIDDKGNKWITDLINTNVDQISEKKFIILSNCLITKNTKHIFLRESKRMIHLNNIVFEDDITNNQTKNRTTVCLNPLFMFGDKLILKGMLDYYKSDVDQIYTYSISYSSELESMLKLSNDLNLLVPWFFNSQRTSLDSFEDYHSITFNNESFIESTKTAALDCYLKHAATTSKFIFVNMNNFNIPHLSFSHLFPTNYNLHNHLLEHHTLTVSKENKTAESTIIELSKLCDCVGSNCSAPPSCTKLSTQIVSFVTSKDKKTYVSNTDKIGLVKKDEENKIESRDLNAFNLVDDIVAENKYYFNDLFKNLCPQLFDQTEDIGTFRAIAEYLKLFQINKSCTLPLRKLGINCSVSSFTFGKSKLKETLLHVPKHMFFVNYADGCHF